MTLSPADFAAAWAEAWNCRQIEVVLAHFADEIEFTSPVAVAVTGAPTMRGKPALRAYWEKAMAQVTLLRFTVVRTVWDPVGRELAIIYDREVNDQRDRALELLRFDQAGQVVSGEVFYGVRPD